MAKHVAGQRGAIAAVVAALRNGSSDADLCVQACKALRNVTFKNGAASGWPSRCLACLTGGPIAAENAQVADSLGAVAAVQAALAAHPSEEALAEEAVWLLCQLASSSRAWSRATRRPTDRPLLPTDSPSLPPSPCQATALRRCTGAGSWARWKRGLAQRWRAAPQKRGRNWCF